MKTFLSEHLRASVSGNRNHKIETLVPRDSDCKTNLVHRSYKHTHTYVLAYIHVITTQKCIYGDVKHL